MKLLAIDTATLVASVAVVDGDDVRSHCQSNVSSHSDNLLVLVDEALKQSDTALADLAGIAIGLGPGSFTGLRIGMSTAKGLAYACDKPLWGASSLAAVALDLAEQAPDPHAIYVPVLDARRSEVFAGFYRVDAAGPHAAGEECVLAPEKLPAHVAKVAKDATAIILGGDATDLYPEVLAASGDVLLPSRTPLATYVARVCFGTDTRVNILVAGTPVYIRASEAEIKFPKGNPGGTFTKSSRKHNG